MQLSWNDRYRDLIGGLDILGVRQLDQGLELQLVGGLTTVAPRARYISLVAWSLAALYRQLLAEGGDKLEWSESRQNAVLTRLEFLVAAATQAGARAEEGGSPTGIVGSDVYREALSELASAGETSFPPTRRPGVLNAYGSPAQAFGLLASAAEAGPLAITPRGQTLVEDMDAPPAAKLLLEGDTLTQAQVESVRPIFSLNGLQTAVGERLAMLAALDKPAGASAAARTDRFIATRAWAIRQLQQQPADGDGLVDRAYEDLVLGGVDTEIAQMWGEVALRKRVHFALELLLAALANTLEADRGSTVAQVVEELQDELEDQLPPAAIEHVIGAQPVDLGSPWSTWQARIEDDAFLSPPPTRNLARLPPAWQLVVALAMLAATERQSRPARISGVVKDRGRQAMEQTFSILANHGGSIAEVAARIMVDEVAARHLRHTMRKMSQQQSNSLRFFPRGAALAPTGTGTGAGFSLTRLNAVLQVMADLGHLQRVQGGFAPTPAGLDWAREVSR